MSQVVVRDRQHVREWVGFALGVASAAGGVLMWGDLLTGRFVNPEHDGLYKFLAVCVGTVFFVSVAVGAGRYRDRLGYRLLMAAAVGLSVPSFLCVFVDVVFWAAGRA